MQNPLAILTGDQALEHLEQYGYVIAHNVETKDCDVVLTGTPSGANRPSYSLGEVMDPGGVNLQEGEGIGTEILFHIGANEGGRVFVSDPLDTILQAVEAGGYSSVSARDFVQVENGNCKGFDFPDNGL